MAAKSSTFYRLEKNIGDGFVSVYEFHTVVNGNRYYVEHEELPSGNMGWSGEEHPCTKDTGNKWYTQLKAKGYKLTGIYEMDICGHKTLIEKR